MFSPSKAAEKASVSRKTIMNAIKSMELKAHRNNENHWVIQATDLANWMKQRQKRATVVPTGTPIDTPTQLPPLSPTPEMEFQLQLTQQELRHTQDKLDNSDREVARLRTEVQELKEEVREARKQTSEAWSMMTKVTGLLDRLTTSPSTRAVDQAKQAPFILSPDMRVEPENIFADVGPSSSDFMNVLAKTKGIIKE